MRNAVLAVTAVLSGLLFAGPAHAQVQLFGGFSYMRQSTTTPTGIACPAALPPLPCVTMTQTTHLNLNGWDASASFNPLPVFGFTADFGGNYGTFQGSTVHVQTYMFGPQVRFPGPISPFAHVLFGAAHETIGAGGSVSASSANAFAAAVGGGLDIKLVPFISLRVIQIDDVMTRFGSATQHQPRASAGLVIHF
jgi:hypothetical protein